MCACKLILLQSYCFKISSPCSEPLLYSVRVFFFKHRIVSKSTLEIQSFSLYKPNASMYNLDTSSVTY